MRTHRRDMFWFWFTILMFAGYLARGAQTQLNVLSFGARPNVVGFDNSTAFNAAIAAAKTLGGGSIYAPGSSGTYWLSNPILAVDANIQIYGDSSINANATDPGTLIKLNAAANKSMVLKEIGTRINIRGITFDGNASAQTISAPGIWLKGDSAHIDRCTIEDTIVKSINGNGVQNDNRESRFYRISISACIGDGFQTTASSDVTIEDILSGFNAYNGVSFVGANATRINRGDIFRNGWNGLALTNANNNEFHSVKADANEQNGILVESTGSSFAYRNSFVQCAPVKNNFYLSYTGAASSVPSGTYSNVKLVGDNTVASVFVACPFWEAQDLSEFVKKPKYLFEDARSFYLTNNFIGSATFIFACNFTADTNYSALRYAQTNLIRYAELDSFLDNSRYFLDNTYYRALQSQQLEVTDQLETLNGMSVNAFYGAFSTTNNWQYSTDGYAWNVRARQDNPMFGIQWVPSGIASNLITWTTALNINSTNGWVGLGLGDTPAVKPLEVMGDLKAATLESNGASFNAYYDGGNWRYRTDGYAYYIQAQSTYNQFVVFTAPLGSAGAVITFVPAIVADETGAVTLPVSVSSPLLSLTALNTGTLSTTNGVIMRTAADGPAAATIGAGNAAMWLSNSIYLYLRTTADGISATDTLVSP